MNTLLRASATVLEARMEIGDALSQPNRGQQLKILNLVRNWGYSNQNDLGLNLSTSLCVPIQSLCTDCTDCPNEKHQGFRLPARFQSVDAAKLRDDHVPGFSPFRTPYDGVSGYANDGSAKLFDNGWAAVERDFECCSPKAIRFSSEGAEESQKMEVTGVTLEDREETVTFSVTGKTVISNQVFKRITQVKFPDISKGRVILSEPNGREIARYEEGSSIPRFREYRLVGGCNAKQLVLVAKSAYSKLTDDTDVVEFGSSLAWQTLAQYIQLLNKSDKSENDRANMRSYLDTGVSLIRGQVSVEKGAVTNTRFRRKAIKGKRLGRSYYGAPR